MTQKQCYFCTTNTKVINYKDNDLLRKYVSPQARIFSRKRTNLCAHHQRMLTQAVKRARFLGLLAFTIR